MRTRSYPARLPHYSTVRALHSDVGPQVGPSCLDTHTASRMRNMVVKGWSVGSPLIGGSRRLRWRLLGIATQRTTRRPFVSKTFHTRCVACVKVSFY